MQRVRSLNAMCPKYVNGSLLIAIRTVVRPRREPLVHSTITVRYPKGGIRPTKLWSFVGIKMSVVLPECCSTTPVTLLHEIVQCWYNRMVVP